jgi:membrane protein DedA with SNARE-associated domain
MEIIEFLRQTSELLGQVVERYGPLGVAVAMFAESAGVPFASAAVVFAAGSMIFSGKVSFWSILLSSTAGITLGSVFSYTLGFMSSSAGRLIKKKISKRLQKKPRQPKRHSRPSKVYTLWERYGSFSVFMAQFWGVTRTFISFPAGAMHMNILVFIVYTALGGALFSLGAIGFSIVFTGAMGLILKLAALFLAQPPWVWACALIILAVLAYLCRCLGWKASPAFFFCKKGGEPPRKDDPGDDSHAS